jgi:hypothetical protein
MMRLVMVPLLLITGAAAAPVSGHQKALMDEIERSVVLPEGAGPLLAYVRNYAFSGPDEVVAIYLIPIPGVAAQTAGKRRWFSDVRSLPFIFDGRCMQVRVDYQISTHRALRVACNGDV